MPTDFDKMGGNIWKYELDLITIRHAAKMTMEEVFNQFFVNRYADLFQYLRQKIPNAKNWK